MVQTTTEWAADCKKAETSEDEAALGPKPMPRIGLILGRPGHGGYYEMIEMAILIGKRMISHDEPSVIHGYLVLFSDSIILAHF